MGALTRLGVVLIDLYVRVCYGWCVCAKHEGSHSPPCLPVLPSQGECKHLRRRCRSGRASLRLGRHHGESDAWNCPDVRISDSAAALPASAGFAWRRRLSDSPSCLGGNSNCHSGDCSSWVRTCASRGASGAESSRHFKREKKGKSRAASLSFRLTCHRKSRVSTQ